MKNLLSQRRAGVLLHISSLPSGDLGGDAYRFVDFLKKIGASVWQTLPLNQPHGDGSPYQCLSSHAGNPMFISMQQLQNQGLLSLADMQSGLNKEALLTIAYDNFELISDAALTERYAVFCKKQMHWLDDFALFSVLRKHFLCAGWNAWPEEYKNREETTLEKSRQHFAKAIERIKFIQFLFFEQWTALKQYANNQGVYMFGDIPIFVAFDSADVWAEPHLFRLDSNKNMTVVAGVPPDYFSVTGQRWGNPHYDWVAMKKQKFAWWLSRMATQSAMFDILRIDHFRGLEAAWEIPANEETAINGAWALAPGEALLKAIKRHLPQITLVAEDLGIITEEVNVLRAKFKLPGMKILQFAFGGGEDNPYLPENIEENSVVYTGTHDNDTSLGWYNSLDDNARQHLFRYLNTDAPDMPFSLIVLALNSKANLAIIPMQDILKLDATHRMNVPGTVVGNWRWRFDWVQLQVEMVEDFTSMIKKSSRI